jgi:hypothetical protein
VVALEVADKAGGGGHQAQAAQDHVDREAVAAIDAGLLRRALILGRRR